jgi:hypothetical protein
MANWVQQNCDSSRQGEAYRGDSDNLHNKGRDAMKSKSIALALGLLIVLVPISVVRADGIPWGYSAGNTEIFNNNNASKTSWVQFSGASGIAQGDSGIIIYNMSTLSGVAESSPDSFANVPFDLSMTLVDVKATGSKSGSAHSSDVVHFSGKFSAKNVTKQSLLPGASPWSSPVLAQAVLGADDVGWRIYSVMLSSFTSPGQPGGSPGSIQAVVTIAPAEAPSGSGEVPGPEVPVPSATPEPTSLILAGMGVLPLIVYLRKRRNDAAKTELVDM